MIRILALEPYYGGSHKAFIDGWSSRSRHAWNLLSLPAYKWKWRMRHSAMTFAHQLQPSSADYQVLFCSDMLNLAEFRGLAPARIAALPTVIYFHENQLTYPVRHASERDYHFSLTNISSALAATAVWFNSAYNRDSFLDAALALLQQMPDHQPLNAIDQIRAKTAVFAPGIDESPPQKPREPGPIRLLWAARWEHDKNPGLFFDALKALKAQGVDFRLSVIGEQFRDAPQIFAQAKLEFQDHIDRWGYQAGRSIYAQVLSTADVFVSTAEHEFFGISAAEAIEAGAYPLLPERLAYPELVGGDEFFYDGTPEQLTQRLASLAQRVNDGNLWGDDPNRARRQVQRVTWPALVTQLDDAIRQVVS